MRLIFLLLFSFSFSALHAQFGASVYYNLNSVDSKLPQDDQFAPDPYQLDNGYEAAVHYWFRLKNKRVEFFPTLYYATRDFSIVDGKLNEFGLQFKTNVYLFDFGGDCDCPTFGKQGPALEKGFFVQLSPGYTRYSMDIPTATVSGSRGSFTVGGGVGLDLGVTNLLTITPFAGFRHGLNGFETYERTDLNGQPFEDIDVTLTTLQLGLSATFRLDHKRY